MTEETTVATEAPAKTSNLPKRVAAALFLVDPEGVKLKAAKYPMPVKAPRFPLGINGVECEAAETSFKDLKYTYFTYQGVDFWVTGHLNKEVEYTFEFPDGYEFKPMKLDRKAQADKAKAAKAAKAPKGEGTAAAEHSPASEESAPEATNAGEEYRGSPSASDAPTTTPKKGKKASR